MSAICPNCRQPIAEVGVACPELGCKRRGYHGIPEEFLADRLDPRIGLQLADKYLLVKLLGRGGMGVVMVALQQPLLREVAVKVIGGVQVDDVVRGRFVREARAVAALDHPNIVKLIDFGVAHLDEDAPFMVMELVGGAEPLRRVFARWGAEPPTWRAFGDIFAQVLAALEAAHAKGLVHRDIKPDNAMAKQASGYDWFVKVLDFGLAKSLEHGPGHGPDMPSLTESGSLVGTPEYMAPEQLLRVAEGLTDLRVDLYAVGVMMFEVVSGRRPYGQVDTMQLVFAKLHQERDPLREAPELESLGPMAAVVRKGMAWDPAERYGSAAEFRKDLLAAVTALGPDVRVPLPSRGAETGGRQGAADAGDLPTLATPGTQAYQPKMATPFTGSLAPVAAAGLISSSVPAQAEPSPAVQVAVPRASQGRKWVWPAVGVGVAALVALGALVLRPRPSETDGQPQPVPAVQLVAPAPRTTEALPTPVVSPPVVAPATVSARATDPAPPAAAATGTSLSLVPPQEAPGAALQGLAPAAAVESPKGRPAKAAGGRSSPKPKPSPQKSKNSGGFDKF